MSDTSKTKASSSEAVGQTKSASSSEAVGHTKKEWPLWEVFVRAKNGLSHRHAGSVHAADAAMAVEAARDVYTRRMEGVSLWVVPSAAIVASDPNQAEAMFAPAEDKVYRHPTFYTLPEGARNI